MSVELLVLRLLHVVGGTLWFGFGVFSSVFLVPSLVSARIDAGPLMAELQRRRLFTVLPVLALVTILSGSRLLWIVSSGFSDGYFRRASGIAYAVGGVASVVAFGVVMSSGRKGPPNPRATAAAVSLLTLAAGLMAVARYL